MLSAVLDRLIELFPKSELIRYLVAARELRWRISKGEQVIYLEYPITPMPRYGFGKPPHPELDRYFKSHNANYVESLDYFLQFVDQLQSISFDQPSDPTQPYWNNDFIGGLEAIGLYCYPIKHRSKLYVEIGSGNSTKFVRRSVANNGLPTRIISIDPYPRAEIDDICDEVRREGLEATDQAIFDELCDGDVLMFDGSHRCFQNSDVTVFFLEILPRLKSGVLVYIDDIYLPLDYPPVWKENYYSEQYLLATLLIAAPDNFRVELPCVYIKNQPVLKERADMLISRISSRSIGYGNGIWLRVM